MSDRGETRRPDDQREAARRRAGRKFLVRGPEGLEGRVALATLAPIGPVAVGEHIGFQLPLEGGAGGPQSFAASSDNPAIKVSVAQGKFLTIGVSHASSGPTDPAFTGNLTFQLFDDLTPLTTSRIEQLVNQGFYIGKDFHRIASGFPGANDYIIQGGSPDGKGSGEVNQPGFPFADEYSQQLVFNGSGQLAMAHLPNQDDTNSSQFFITTGSPRSLDFEHTIFGQIVSGQSLLPQITSVARNGETPVKPVTITSTTLSATNPDAVLHIDATAASAGQTANVAVTATDPSDNSTVSRTFQVVVTPNTDSSGQPVSERPFLQPVPNQVVGLTQTTPTVQGQAAIFKLQGVDANPGDELTYIVRGGKTTGSNPTFTNVQNATATVDQNGVVTVTPNAGFTGVINLLVGVRDQVNRTSGSIDSVANFDTQAITLTVTNGAPVNLPPIAFPSAEAATIDTPKTIQLVGDTANPASNQTLFYDLVSRPQNGTVSQFDPQAGTLVYTPNPGFQGQDTLSFRVRDQGDPGPSLLSAPATVTIHVGGGDTGAVRQIGRVLVVTPLPRTDSVPNVITVAQEAGKLVVTVNNVIDALQPNVADLNRLVVFGSKASDQITVGPEVTVPATLDGGHGGYNVVQAGGAPTRMHGWFGGTTLTGGPQADALLGRQGFVRFRPSLGPDVFFAGSPVRPSNLHRYGPPPSGTFYRTLNGRIVPIDRRAATGVGRAAASPLASSTTSIRAARALAQAHRLSALTPRTTNT